MSMIIRAGTLFWIETVTLAVGFGAGIWVDRRFVKWRKSRFKANNPE